MKNIMRNFTIAHVVGARPNFVKLAVVYSKLDEFNQLIIHTGQHYDYELSRVFFEELNIPMPDYNLNVGSGSHGYQVGEILRRCEKILVREEPSLVTVYGDTNSTLAGALATVKLGIPVAHVEAGLRCGLRYMAEEVNRVLVDHISELLFAPTRTAVRNLHAEGIKEGVYFTGDVMLDLFLRYKDRLFSKEEDFILATVHRAENVDDPHRLKAILEALIECGERVIFPMHPRTRRRIKEFGFTWFFKARNVKIFKPLGYIKFLRLMARAEKVITDSGGVQKEAFFMGKPCITLREVTEWVETVKQGWNILVGTDKIKIINAIRNFRPKSSSDLSVFGDGRAGEKIADIIRSKFGL